MFSLDDTHRELDTPTAFPVDPDPTGAGMLGTQMVAAHVHVSAVTGRLFELIARMEDTDAFQPTYANAAAWMRWHLGLDSRTARSYVRISRRLRDLPVTAAALSDGRLSLDRLKVLLRVVEADSATDLVEFAVACADVDTLRDRVADIENAPSPPEPRTIWEGPRATMWWRDDILHLNATIPGIDGATVEQAILRLADNAPPDPQTGLYRDPSDRFGDALVQMGSQALAADGDHDRATVVVHIAAEDLSTKKGVGYDTAGRLFGTSELDHILCDARIQPALHDSDGITIGVGRITRTIPSWLVRAIQERDKEAVDSLAVAEHGGSTATTSSTGPTVDPPTSTTSSHSAASTTACSTTRAGKSKETPMANSGSSTNGVAHTFGLPNHFHPVSPKYAPSTSTNVPTSSSENSPPAAAHHKHPRVRQLRNFSSSSDRLRSRFWVHCRIRLRVRGYAGRSRPTFRQVPAPLTLAGILVKTTVPATDFPSARSGACRRKRHQKSQRREPLMARGSLRFSTHLHFNLTHLIGESSIAARGPTCGQSELGGPSWSRHLSVNANRHEPGSEPGKRPNVAA